MLNHVPARFFLFKFLVCTTTLFEIIGLLKYILMLHVVMDVGE